jgi:hypothetical protein
MAKKPKKRIMLKTTDWNVGQPLAFPEIGNGFKRLAREAVNEATRGPFSSKQAKRKKK